MSTFHEEVERRIQRLAASGDWSVSEGSSAQVELALTVVYRVAFGSAIEEARPGPLPSSAIKVFSGEDLRTMLEALRTSKERALAERLDGWLNEHAGSWGPTLSTSACLGSAPSFGYQFPCERCAVARQAECELCGATGLRHVTGTVACHVGRASTLTLTGVPENAPAWLRDATSAEPLRAFASLALIDKPYRAGMQTLRYQGAFQLAQCEVQLAEQSFTVWDYDGVSRDLALVVERLLEPACDRLGSALVSGKGVASAARAFFAAPLHLALSKDERPERTIISDRLVSAKYLERAQELAQEAVRAMARHADRKRSLWILALPVLVAPLLHAAPLSGFLAASLAGGLACLAFVLMELHDRRALRTAWGLSFSSPSAYMPALLSFIVAASLAGLPSVLPLRLLHELGARDYVTGIYACGEERLLMLPIGRNSYVMRHVTADCDEFALVELHASGSFVRADSEAPFVRSEGLSFVLLPNPKQGCGEHTQPVRFTRNRAPLECEVATDRARPFSLAHKPFALARGARVEVLPWTPDLRQVLVRSATQIGTLHADQLACSAAALSSLRDALFRSLPTAEPRAHAK